MGQKHRLPHKSAQNPTYEAKPAPGEFAELLQVGFVSGQGFPGAFLLGEVIEYEDVFGSF